MDLVIWIVWIVVGVPVLAGISVAIVALIRGWWVKARELKLQEQRIRMEEKLRMEELNARLLRAEDPALTTADAASLLDEIRQLRQEVAELRQQINSRKVY